MDKEGRAGGHAYEDDQASRILARGGGQAVAEPLLPSPTVPSTDDSTFNSGAGGSVTNPVAVFSPEEDYDAEDARCGFGGSAGPCVSACAFSCRVQHDT